MSVVRWDIDRYTELQDAAWISTASRPSKTSVRNAPDAARKATSTGGAPGAPGNKPQTSSRRIGRRHTGEHDDDRAARERQLAANERRLAQLERELVAQHDESEPLHFRAMNMHERAAEIHDAMDALLSDGGGR